MANPIEILKDANKIQRLYGSTEETTVNFDRDVIVFNRELFEEYGISMKLSSFSTMAQIDSLTYCEYELALFQTASYDNVTALISSEGDTFIICYADEAARAFGFNDINEFITDVRRREKLYEDDIDYDNGIPKETDVSNISDVIPFSGTMTFRGMPKPTEPNYDELVIKCESENGIFYIAVNGFDDSECNYYLNW